jgi:hypothetical protein
MWTAKDNNKATDRDRAVKYCRNLRLAGYSDWRLATLAELAGIYDKNAQSISRSHWYDAEPTTYHVKGNLLLTGRQWGNSRDNGWYLDFTSGEGVWGDPYYPEEAYALCVRGTGNR